MDGKLLSTHPRLTFDMDKRCARRHIDFALSVCATVITDNMTLLSKTAKTFVSNVTRSGTCSTERRTTMMTREKAPISQRIKTILSGIAGAVTGLVARIFGGLGSALSGIAGLGAL